MLTLETSMLRPVVEDAEQRMREFRDLRRQRIQKYLGYRYSINTDCSSAPRFQNLIALQVNTIGRFLVSSNPRCTITTTNPRLGPEAYSLENVMNRRFEKLRLGDTLSECAKDAMLSGMSVTKIGRTGDTIGDSGKMITYCHRVDLDDFVFDLMARSWDECTFIGNWYRLPIEYVEASGLYDLEGVTLQEDDDSVNTVSGNKRTSSIGSGMGQSLNRQRLVKFTNLLDLYLPLHGKVLTLTDDYQIIREEDWSGPNGGPFRILKFLDAPGQLFPLALVATVEDLEGAINEMYRKLSEQAQNQKDVGAAPISGHKDTEALVEAPDGSIVNVMNTAQIQMFKFRGPDPGVAQLAVMWRQQFLELAGGLQQLAAMGPQADTASQERLLAATASSMVNALQDQMTEFTADVMKDITWYRWHSIDEEDVEKNISGRVVVERFGGMNRSGMLSDYDLLLEPFSMQRKTPAERLNLLNQIVQSVILPAMPIMAQQGIMFSFPDYLDYIAKYSGGSELLSMLRYTSPMRQAMETESAMMKMPTHSVYERVNRPGVNRQQQDQMLAGMMAGQNAQPAEMASAVRTA